MEDIIKINSPILSSRKYMVYVRTCTFNQSPFILDCLKSVAEQKTDFAYIHHVIDDCSTDGEQETIKCYLARECDMKNSEYYENEIANIIIVNYLHNLNCTIVAYFLKENYYKRQGVKRSMYRTLCEICSYVALCEGDDYWTDPLKLKKQVSFLEANKDYSLIGGNADVYKANGEFLNKFSDRPSCNISIDTIINSWSIPTASLLYRSELEKGIPVIENAPQGDIIIQMTCADKGMCKYDSDVCCVYRWLAPGSSTLQVRNNQLNYYQRHYEMWEALNEHFLYRYNYIIQVKLKETRRKMLREKMCLKFKVLQKLRTLYRNYRGY